MDPLAATHISAMYIGQQLATLLFGATVVQAWIFAKHCGDDRMYLKALVAVIMLLGTVVGVLMPAALYYSLMTAVGDTFALTSAHWTNRVLPFIMGPIISIVQWFYGFRLYRLTKSIPLFAIILLLGLSPLTLGFAGAANDLRRTIGGNSSLSQAISCASLVIMMVCDAIITIAMVYYLQNHRSGIKSTETMLSTLTNYTLASGLITAVAACLDFITYVAVPQRGVYVAISYLLPHLYTNSFLALLNARRSLRRGRSSHISLIMDPERAETAARPFSISRKRRSGGESSDFLHSLAAKDTVAASISPRAPSVHIVNISQTSQPKAPKAPELPPDSPTPRGSRSRRGTL